MLEGRAISNMRQVSLQVTGVNWTTVRAMGIVYQTLNGVWRLQFNIHGTLSVGAVSQDINLTGFVFPSNQIGAGGNTASNAGFCNTFGAVNGDIRIQSKGTSGTVYLCSGDFEIVGNPPV